MLFDAEVCDSDPHSPSCPSFTANFDTNEVELLDRYGHLVPMDASDFNEFVQKVRSGEIQKVPSTLTGSEVYRVGNATFSADASANRMVFSNEKGNAQIDPKHFNIFVDAVLDGRLQEV